MDMQQTPMSSPKTRLPVDDFFEDFDFKPLSPGLGFHQTQRSDEAIEAAKKVVIERSIPTKPIKRVQHPFEQHQLKTQATTTQPDFIHNDLALFYARGTTEAAPLLDDIPQVQPSAPKGLRMVAFTIDNLIIAGLASVTVQLVNIVAKVDLWAGALVLDPTLWMTLGVLFIAYFLLYFTLWESVQGKSLGKELVGLKLHGLRRIPMTQIFARSFVCLVGYLSLGLTNYFELPEKLTDIRVVRV